MTKNNYTTQQKITRLSCPNPNYYNLFGKNVKKIMNLRKVLKKNTNFACGDLNV